MSDRVQINALERAASTDINDLQSMATRIVADLYGFDQSTKLEGPLAPDIPRSFTGGLNFIGDGGNNALSIDYVQLTCGGDIPVEMSSFVVE